MSELLEKNADVIVDTAVDTAEITAVEAEQVVVEATDAVAVTEAAPAKPARKPRAIKIAETAQVEVPAPRKRGRPRKDASAIAAPAVAKVLKTAKPAAAPKAAPAKVAKPVVSRANQIKEEIMTTTTETVETIKTAMTDVQDKAKEVYAKSTAVLGEAGEFTKGNVEALVVSGKILANGLQGMGKTMVDDTKVSFETMTADVKAITAVKSPTELVQLQGEIARRNLDTMIAVTTKNGEAMMKLANDVFAPISGRFSLAMEKVRKAA